jgi:hypothetical protein
MGEMVDDQAADQTVKPLKKSIKKSSNSGPVELQS